MWKGHSRVEGTYGLMRDNVGHCSLRVLEVSNKNFEPFALNHWKLVEMTKKHYTDPCFMWDQLTW